MTAVCEAFGLRRRLFAAAALVVALAGAAHAQTLNVQTHLAADSFALKHLDENWVPRFSDMMEVDLLIELLPVDSVVPRRETPGAVSAGLLDGDLTTVRHFAGKDPAFALMGDLFGAHEKPEQATAFCKEGGGREVLQALHDAFFHQVKVVGCGAVSRGISVSRESVEGVDGLTGLTVGAPAGLTAEAFRRAGATVATMADAALAGALSAGEIDVATASSYADIAAASKPAGSAYSVLSEFQSIPIVQFTVSSEIWEEMSERDKVALGNWFGQLVDDLTSAIGAENKRLIDLDQAAGHLTTIDWSEEERERLGEIVDTVLSEFATGSDLAGQVHDAINEHQAKADPK